MFAPKTCPCCFDKLKIFESNLSVSYSCIDHNKKHHYNVLFSRSFVNEAMEYITTNDEMIIIHKSYLYLQDKYDYIINYNDDQISRISGTCNFNIMQKIKQIELLKEI